MTIASAATVLLWFAAIGSGLLAGLFYAFSAFIMSALRRAGANVGIDAMNAINDTILRSSFMPLFLGTTLASAALIAIALLQWGGAGTMAMLSGGLLLVLGMFACTMFANVPLNNALKAAGSGEHALPVWQRFLDQWTRWNHVRTAACTLACILFVLALVQRA